MLTLSTTGALAHIHRACLFADGDFKVTHKALYFFYLRIGEKGDVFVALEVEIEVVEPMGHEVYLHLRLGARTLVARVPTEGEGFTVGSMIPLHLDLKKAHLFDASGDTIL